MLAWSIPLLTLCLTTSLHGVEHPWQAAPGKEGTWKRTHQALVQRATKGDIALYFLGDSLTAHWTSTGRVTWHLDLLPQKAVNFGVSADRVQHILYRISHGELPKSDPKTFVLMLGTNNLAQQDPDSPEDVTRGIKHVLTQIKKHNPTSKILLLSILPNGDDPNSPVRKSILATNERLATLADEQSISFKDIHAKFLRKDGTWKPELTIDHTHLSSAGYEKLYQLVKQPLEKLGAD